MEDKSYSELINLYNTFSESIKYRSRFFHDNKVTELLKEATNRFASSIEQETILYRARINRKEDFLNTNRDRYSCTEMGPPPVGKTSSGRANPRGIIYLYTAFDPLTAIAEVRPWNMSDVTIARLVTTKKMSIVDATIKTKPRDITEAYQFIIRSELETPIDPTLIDFDYLPTQYICELMKTLGYAGVKYNSSLNNKGKNLVLFDFQDVKYEEETDLYTVRELMYECQKK